MDARQNRLCDNNIYYLRNGGFNVKRNKNLGWKKACAAMMAAAMTITMLPVNSMAQTSATAVESGKFSNPVIYADVPDMDIIRVNDTYYMVSTTMHLSPGCPIMKSKDLVNWEIVNYVYDILGDTDAMNLRNGESMYGNGQWAASLQYHNNKYYVAFNSNTTGHAYIYTTDDIENGSWTKTELANFYHDMALFFDGDTPYIVYGSGEIKYVELSEDLSGEKEGGKRGTLFSAHSGADAGKFDGGLSFEGTHVMKKDGYYYVFNICWPSGKPRIEVCHRSKSFIGGTWETKEILNANFSNNGTSGGVAQGGVIDTEDGRWYGFMFQDHGAIGRTPVLTDCTWIDGWPMLGKNGDGKTVEAEMELPVEGSESKSLVKSDEFYNDAEHRVFDAAKEGAESHMAMMSADIDATGADDAKTEPAETPEDQTVELVANGSFDDGTKGWRAFEGGTISAETDKSGNNYGKITGRTGTGSGLAYDLSGKIVEGVKYHIKAKIKYDNENGPATRKFNITFQNGTAWNYRQVAGGVDVAKGKWTEIECDYVPGKSTEGNPFSSVENTMFFETGWVPSATAENDLMDFYVDDVSVTYNKSDLPDEEENDNLIELITNGDVETGKTTGWRSTPQEPDAKDEKNAVLTAVAEEGASGKYCLSVANRLTTGMGACQDISGKLEFGKTYTISGKLKYTTGPDTKKFMVTIQNGDNYNWRENLVTINATKGKWATFKGTYTVHDKSESFPFDPTKNFIFIETPWTQNPTAENDQMAYYLDDFSMTTEDDNIVKNGSFEKGKANWTGFEGGTIEIKDDAKGAQDGSKYIAATKRTACAQGPSQDVSNKLSAGSTYVVSAWVKYDAKDAVDSKSFNMTIQNGPNYKYRKVIKSATAKKGEWTQITGEYTMPDDAITNQNYIFFETGWAQSPTKTDDLMDFYVDNVTVKEKVVDKEPAESGEHDYNGSDLDLVWQWNHNPNNNNWSLTDRAGWLRLTTGSKATSILNARNTLTQRTFGPTCSGKIKMDISGMKNGDYAGLAAFSYNYGYIAVKKEGTAAKLVMVDAHNNQAEDADKPRVAASVDCKSDIVYLKEDFNFAGGDKVTFYYSFDGSTWTQLGDPMQLSYELKHFMGSKFAIFNYATKSTGGYADFDYFRVTDKLTGTDAPEAKDHAASLSGTEEISGVINSEATVKVTMDALIGEGHTDLKASLSIPSGMDVKDVTFNSDAITGETSWDFKNGHLVLQAAGKDLAFKAADQLFATVTLKMTGYADKDTTVNVSADYITADKGTVEYDVKACSLDIKEKYLDTKALAKKLGYSNPLVTTDFGADPYAIVYNGRVYVYMTSDDYEYDADGKLVNNSFNYIKTLRIISSDDMVNWTDHGEIKVAGNDGAAKWASHSWAPAIAYKQIDGKDKFFLYFANDASGIGVLEADTPLGPWKDPIGKALLTGKTPGCEGVVWCFDPAVLVDDDGSAYIYFGGGVPDGQQNNPKTARVAKLGEDMISIDGEAKEIDAPCMFEDSGIFKYGDKYYYSYCSNFISPHKDKKDGYPGYGTICYMVSDNPMGPFKYAGEVFENPQKWFGVGGNNHHATFVYEGKSYFIYHAQTLSKAQEEAQGLAPGTLTKGYRSTHIDPIELNSDGTIRPIAGTYEGISQLKTINPYERIDAETVAWNAGIKIADCAEEGKLFKDFNRQITDLQDGDWTSVAQAAFGNRGAAEFTVKAASKSGGQIEIHMDSPEGALVGTVNVEATGSEDTFKEFSCKLDRITDTHNVFLVFKGKAENLMNIDYYSFGEYQVKTEALSSKIAEAERLLSSLTGSAKTDLEKAIAEAKALLEKADADQGKIDNVFDSLSKAYNTAKATISDGGKKDDDTKKPDGSTKKPTNGGTDGNTQTPANGGTDGNTQTPSKDSMQSYVRKTFTIGKKLTYKVTACSKKVKTVTVIGSKKQLKSITIPATVTYRKMKFKVTEISKNAFKKQKKLTKVTIGNNVTKIGANAFYGDKKLSKVTIGKNVTNIGANAFYGDKKLSKVTIKGKNLKKIGKNAFKKIKKSATFKVPKGKAKAYKNMLKKAKTSSYKVK
jgi:beta-xylosidase